MPAEQSTAASLRRRSSLSRDGVPEQQKQPASSTPSAKHTRGSSTSTSVNYPYPRQSLSISNDPDEHEELTVDFEESIHLNNLESNHLNGNGKMGRNNAYSSLPTTSNGHSMHDYPSSSSSSASGSRRRAGRGESRWSALPKWQKNTLIVAVVLVCGILFLNSGQGPASDYVLRKTNKEGGTATSEEDSRVVQRPAQGQEKPKFQPDTHETGLTRPLANDAGTGGVLADSKPKKITSGSSCILPPGKQEFQWALMIDAGSTGSRMHVYKFSNCLPEGTSVSSLKEDPLPTLVDELFYPITPGLSYYRGRPKAAAESLTKLMEEAVKAVPKSERGCTPIAVKATAGLRLLGATESQEILDEVERWLKKEWPFQVVEDGVVIMDGKDEGVYAWITINYVRRV